MLTGSLALVADAYHSLSDFFVSIAVFCGILFRKWRERKYEAENGATDDLPPLKEDDVNNDDAPEISKDDKTKTAAPGYLAEAIVAYLVSIAILYIPYEIITNLKSQNSYEIKNLWIGIVGVIFCICVTYFISRFKIIVGRETDSPGLKADGYHSRVDMFSSIAVLASLLGSSIGIQIDNLVAVIIAVLIAIVGLQLFISSIIGFARRTNIRHFNVWSWLFSKLDSQIGSFTEILFGRRVSLPGFKLIDKFRFDRLFGKKFLALYVVLGVLGYALSGMTVIAPDETGVHFRFGAIIDSKLEPGLHYRLPRPFESIVKVRSERIYRVELGFRTSQSLKGIFFGLLWETRHSIQGYQKIKQESIILTGDENIIDMSLVVHYRPTDAVVYRFMIKDMEMTVRGLTESIVRENLATETADDILITKRADLQDHLKADLIREVRKLELGIEILGVFLHDLHPPLEVVPTFRDVFSAREDKSKMLNEALAHKNEAIPKARGKSEARRLDAQAFEIEQSVKANGDAEKFKLLASAFQLSEDITRYRLFIEAIEKGLSGRTKIIADPDVNRGEYRIWTFSPLQSPFSMGRGTGNGDQKK